MYIVISYVSIAACDCDCHFFHLRAPERLSRTLRIRRAHNYRCIVPFPQLLFPETSVSSFFFSFFMLRRRAFNEIVSGVSNRTHSATTITLLLDENEFKKQVNSCYISLSCKFLKLFLRTERSPTVVNSIRTVCT